MKLDEMNILEKANILENLLKENGFSDEGIKQSINNLIENAKIIFGTGTIDILDTDVSKEAYAKYQASLDGYLRMFPEFNETVERHI